LPHKESKPIDRAVSPEPVQLYGLIVIAAGPAQAADPAILDRLDHWPATEQGAAT
jgi:hypothetical protein